MAMPKCKLSERLTLSFGAVPWQVVQETALLDKFFLEVGAVATATSRTTMGAGGSKVVPAFRGSKKGNTAQASARWGWSGRVVLHGLCI